MDDYRPRRYAQHQGCAVPSGVAVNGVDLSVDRVIAVMEGRAALPRKNGELVFDEPWHGRVFGMAVALHEQGRYDWEEFRRELIGRVAAADAGGGPFVYYEIWLATFEALLGARGLITAQELGDDVPVRVRRAR